MSDQKTIDPPTETTQEEPTQEESTNDKSAKKELIEELEKLVGKDALETIPNLDGAEEVIRKSGVGETVSVPGSEYVCQTQVSLPVRPLKVDPHAIWVGYGGKIPRWKKGSTVNFAAFSGGYPTPNNAIFAAYRLNEAAQKWNSYNVGVKFKWVGKLADAAFVLAYGGDQGNTLARAFFPNSNDLNTLFVYKKAFEPGFVNFMTNVFLHELGHVIGLRHEFAASEGGAVKWGASNPLSVMSYKFPPIIQTSDVTDTTSFYNYTGATYGPYRIENVIPDN